jgi:hypothetical protein
MPLGEVLEVTLRVTAVLEDLGIEYLVGGSLASSLHGIPRSTQDVDLVARILPAHVAPLVSALVADFYIDEDMIRDAVKRRATFNIIDLTTMFKLDVFVAKGDVVSRQEMQRRQTVSLGGDPEKTLVVSTAEDIVLHKLEWYRLGNEISERQWTDVLGVIKVQGERLDRKYLTETAELMDLRDLLARALAAAADGAAV